MDAKVEKLILMTAGLVKGVIGQSNGLPRIPGVTLPKGPETVMPLSSAQMIGGYPTFVIKSFGKGETP